jgi:osmoprotectant transport system ATP-binding protein
VIVLDGVEKFYGTRRILGPIALDVPAGHRLAVIGPSGCGKSTLLRVILGLVHADRGAVSIAGHRMEQRSKRALRLRVGYVVQDGGLFPHLTAERNVTLVARHLGWTAERARVRVDELAALAGLDREMLTRFPLEMSGGQRQRVGIMRALMLDPDVLLMDEPLGALDPVTRARLQGELASLLQALQKTMILVTHDIAEAERLADEAIVLQDGIVAQRGTVAAMRSAPANAFVAELLRARTP